MAYQATVIPVMIASPGDVLEERKIIREVIHDWNDVNSSASKVILAPQGRESHSSPELGQRPQELINKRVLKSCDLLVGVFWTRIGSPTGKAQSGTVEEIQEHIAQERPAMIYFSSKPTAPETLDPEQFKQLTEFKEWCKSQGLVEFFDNSDGFRSKFSKQLQLCILNNPHLKKITQQKTGLEEESTAENIHKHPTYKLSKEAEILVVAAAKDENGTIMKLQYISGREIQAGFESFGQENSRDSATWEAALDELVKNQLVVSRGYKGEMFELTLEGWKLADRLKISIA